jgi:hypothetical protein
MCILQFDIDVSPRQARGAAAWDEGVGVCDLDGPWVVTIWLPAPTTACSGGLFDSGR